MKKPYVMEIVDDPEASPGEMGFLVRGTDPAAREWVVVERRVNRAGSYCLPFSNILEPMTQQMAEDKAVEAAKRYPDRQFEIHRGPNLRLLSE